MTPLPDKPSIVILVKNGKYVINVASNISKDPEVIVTEEPLVFSDLSKGKPFVYFPVK